MFSIAIDGPSGSGKSTVAQLIAKQLNFQYLNSGSIYRAIALYAIRNNLTTAIDFNWLVDLKIDLQQYQVFLNTEDVTSAIRSPECAQMASKLATLEPVRNFVNKEIVKFSQTANIIVDGRDIGSVVLPHAQLKIYLDASVEVRAKRILEHNLKLNITSKTYEEIIVEVQERDARDKQRLIAPLTKASDAIYLDSSNLNRDQVINEIIKLWSTRSNND